MTQRTPGWLVPTLVVLTVGCGKNDEPEPPPEQPLLAPGDACDPAVVPAAQTADPEDDKDPQPVCAPGLACEPLAAGGDHVCGTELVIVGRVTNSTTGVGIEGALVVAFNENGEPVTDVVASDACGDYRLPVSVRREANGEFAESLKWTLGVSARDHQPFPTGLRPALPIDMSDAAPDPEWPADPPEEDAGKAYPASVIQNAATSVGLISLGLDPIGVRVTGSLGPAGAGALVVAEGAAAPAPYGIADASGAYTLFNVPAGATTIRAYRKDLAAEALALTVGAEDVVDADLARTDPAQLATVTGALSIVNAPGGSLTSVVLVPASVYNAALERGPVPLGLRDPPPPAAPDVTGGFMLTGVPDGTYKVLVAFENDFLVRDPDMNIAGTQIQEITVDGGAAVAVPDGFKVTEALAIRGPGADGPEQVEATPTFVWADDSSEDGYTVVVYDALGEEVWTTELPGVSGGGDVSLAYAGPALQPGMYYQFRVTSWRETQNKRSNIARTEDLRGVFVHGEAPPLPECTVDEDTTGGESSGG